MGHKTQRSILKAIWTWRVALRSQKGNPSRGPSSERAAVWGDGWHQMHTGWPVITSSTMAVFVLVWRFFSGLHVLVIQGNVNTVGKLSFYNHLHPWKARGKTNNILHRVLCRLWMWRHYSLIKCTSRLDDDNPVKSDIYKIFKRLCMYQSWYIRLVWFIYYDMKEYGAQSKERKKKKNQLNSDAQIEQKQCNLVQLLIFAWQDEIVIL